MPRKQRGLRDSSAASARRAASSRRCRSIGAGADARIRRRVHQEVTRLCRQFLAGFRFTNRCSTACTGWSTRPSICLAVGIALGHTRRRRAARIAHDLGRARSSSITSWPSSAGCTAAGAARGCGAKLAACLLTWAYTVPVLLGIGLVTQYNADFSYESKLIWILDTPAAMVAARIVLRKIQQRLRARGFNTRSYAICGVNELGIQLARNIERAPEMGLRLAGFYDDGRTDRTAELPGEVGPRVGNLDELVHRARRGDIDIIYITFPMRAEERIRDVLAKLADTTASVYIVPDFFVFELLHARWTNVNGLPAVSVFENPLYGVDGLAKRTADLVFGSLMLAAAAVPMLVIAAAIKLTSPGPVFFRQRRYGLDGREILVWKFRTMTCCDDGRDVRQATRDDDRVTPSRPVLAADVARRAAAAVQRDRRQHVARRPAAARQRPQRAVPLADRRLHAAAQSEAGHHGPGPGERLPRRNRDARKDGATRRLRPPVHPRMVALDGRQDPGEDAAVVLTQRNAY